VTVTPTPSGLHTAPTDCESLIDTEDVGFIFGGLTDAFVNDEFPDMIECTYASGLEKAVTISYAARLQLSVDDFSESYQNQGRTYVPGLGEAAFFTELSPDVEPKAPMLSVLFEQSMITVSSEEVSDKAVYVQLADAALERVGYTR
jgi:hypothetical protein